jgi:hypothetical protein
MRRWSQPARSAWFKDEFADEDLSAGIDRMNHPGRIARGRGHISPKVARQLQEGALVWLGLDRRIEDLAFGADRPLKRAGTLIRAASDSRAFLSQRFFAGTRFLRVMLSEMRSLFAF